MFALNKLITHIFQSISAVLKCSSGVRNYLYYILLEALGLIYLDFCKFRFSEFLSTKLQLIEKAKQAVTSTT